MQILMWRLASSSVLQTFPSVYGAHYLLEGLYRSGEEEYALELLTSQEERSWAHMIYDLGASVAHEAWDPRFKPNEDWNHAWGAAPANLIPRWLMGIRPLTAGFSSFVINPRPGSLRHAQIRVPTLKGTIDVAYERTDEERILNVSVPANTSAYIVPPCPAWSAMVQLNGVQRGTMIQIPPEGIGPLSPGECEVRCT